MIYTLNFNDTKKFGYISELKCPKELTFKPGINVLCGENGSGKSTVLNILMNYTFCYYTEESTDLLKGPIGAAATYLEFLKSDILDEKPVLDTGIKVVADYSKKTYSPQFYTKKGLESASLESLQDVQRRLNKRSLSEGQYSISVFGPYLDKLIKEDVDHTLDLSSFGTASNDLYKNRIGILVEWLLKLHKEGEVPTILLDEPDRHLGISYLSHLAYLLVEASKKYQVIVSLHNPLLIQIFRKRGANIIELSENYLSNLDKALELI